VRKFNNIDAPGNPLAILASSQSLIYLRERISSLGRLGSQTTGRRITRPEAEITSGVFRSILSLSCHFSQSKVLSMAFGMTSFGIKTFGMMTFGIMTFGIATCSLMAFFIKTLGIMIYDIRHNDIQHDGIHPDDIGHYYIWHDDIRHNDI
jgi:uncharacterized protein YaiE (UPF0345 family)